MINCLCMENTSRFLGKRKVVGKRRKGVDMTNVSDKQETLCGRNCVDSPHIYFAGRWVVLRELLL